MIKWIVIVFDKLAPPGECILSCRYSVNKAEFCSRRITFQLNLKVTQWPSSMNLTLLQHCSQLVTNPIIIQLKSLLKCENPKCNILRWKFDLDPEVKVKWSKEICVSSLRLSKSSNRVMISHQMAEISRFMWKWPWPQF